MKDFEAGIAIIESYIPDKAKSMRALRSESRMYSFFEQRLSELDAKAIVVQAEDLPEPEPKPKKQISNTQSDHAPKTDLNKSEAIRVLEDSNKLILKNEGFILAQLSAIGRDGLGRPIHLTPADKEQRKQMRDQIVDWEEQLHRNWHAIQHIQIYGTLPDEHPDQKKETKTDLAAPVDFQQKESNRKMISYLKGQIAERKKELSGLTGDKLVKAHRALSKQEANLDERLKLQQQWQAAK